MNDVRRLFIINPSAGAAGKGHNGLEKTLSELETYFKPDFDYVLTKTRADAEKRTSKALHEGVDQIVAVGGDGTVNAVVNGFFENGEMIRPEACLAIGPLGTGCDYFRTLKGYGISDWKRAVVDCRPWAVDVGHIRFDSKKFKDRYFINMASVGLSAEIAHDKNQGPKWMPAQLSYIVPTISRVMRSQAHPVCLKIDDSEIELDLISLFMAKGIYAGGGMRFGGGVALDDGLLDVTVLPKMPVYEMVVKLSKLYTGGLASEGKIKKYRAKRVRVEAVKSKASVPIEFDGEVYGSIYGSGGLEVSVKYRVMKICVP